MEKVKVEYDLTNKRSSESHEAKIIRLKIYLDKLYLAKEKNENRIEAMKREIDAMYAAADKNGWNIHHIGHWLTTWVAVRRCRVKIARIERLIKETEERIDWLG